MFVYIQLRVCPEWASLQHCVCKGPNPYEHEGKPDKGGEERDEKNTSEGGFSYSFTDFSCWSSKPKPESLSNSQTVQSLF